MTTATLVPVNVNGTIQNVISQPTPNGQTLSNSNGQPMQIYQKPPTSVGPVNPKKQTCCNCCDCGEKGDCCAGFFGGLCTSCTCCAKLLCCLADSKAKD